MTGKCPDERDEAQAFRLSSFISDRERAPEVQCKGAKAGPCQPHRRKGGRGQHQGKECSRQDSYGTVRMRKGASLINMMKYEYHE